MILRRCRVLLLFNVLLLTLMPCRCRSRRNTETCHYPVLFCAVAFTFLQLHLKSAVHISFQGSLFHEFCGRSILCSLCGVHRRACLAMLSSMLLNVSQSYSVLLLNCSSFSSDFPQISVSCLSSDSV